MTAFAHMKKKCWFSLSLLLAGCALHRHADPSDLSRGEVRKVLEKQVAEWNAGNLAGFMETYARTSNIRFASGGDITLGWQTVFDRYRKRYGDKETMGKLKFSDMHIQMLAPDSVLADGRWHLTLDGGEASRLDTRNRRNAAEGWRIVHDHAAAAAPP